jgi:hypothetical protein
MASGGTLRQRRSSRSCAKQALRISSLTHAHESCIQEIETHELRPAGSLRWAFDFFAKDSLLCMGSAPRRAALLLACSSLVILNRPLRRGFDSKSEFIPMGATACSFSCI